MNTKQTETEAKIVEYFRKNIEESIKIKKEHYGDFIKIPFTYIDYSAPISFAPDPIDFAIYSIKEKKYTAIEYPWRLDNGDLVYNTIELL
jgi:hypothetical protein